MFVMALFISDKTWKQPRCPSGSEWINKQWYLQTVEYYLVLRRNKLLSYENTFRKLRCIFLRIQSERTPHIPYDSNSILEKGNYGDSKKTTTKNSGCQGLEGERDE